MIRDGGAEALQPAIAMVGYILPSSKLETEKLNVIATDPEARPFDISFNIDPSQADEGPLHVPTQPLAAMLSSPLLLLLPISPPVLMLKKLSRPLPNTISRSMRNGS